MGNSSEALRLAAGAVEVLQTAPADRKAEAARALARAWRAGPLPEAPPAPTPLPLRPARPARPELRPPREMPRRRGRQGHAALLHALAHIELNAIDLACDMVARFGSAIPGALPALRFLDDWIGVADDEARHFQLLAARLAAMGLRYGDLPAHDGLWQAAADTAHDLLGRLAVVPLVLEARGLDVTPSMIRQFDAAADHETSAILRVIHDDEIGHVAIGRYWFEAICAERGLDPVGTWQALVVRLFRGRLKRPFNTESRKKAGFPPAFYEPLADRPDGG